MSLSSYPPSIRDYFFRGLSFESEAQQYRNSGLRIGADEEHAERQLLNETLEPFGISLRNEALRMARLYALVYCFESSVRTLIKQRLMEVYEDDWWSQGVPTAIQRHAEGRQETAASETWLEGSKSDILEYCDFGHLAKIIVDKWADFSDLMPTQHWVKQRFDELEKARHFVAHNRLLSDGEFARIEMYIGDWNRTIGL